MVLSRLFTLQFFAYDFIKQLLMWHNTRRECVGELSVCLFDVLHCYIMLVCAHAQGIVHTSK